MNRDGEVNYSNFSSDELREAYDGINPTSYPVNFKNLLDEMAVRGISTNGSPENSPQSFASLGTGIGGIVALAVFCTMLFVSFYGSVQFPDRPIDPCGVDQYCGKQGQLHTQDEYRAYRHWEMTMFVLWPGGIFTIAVLALRRSKAKKGKAIRP